MKHKYPVVWFALPWGALALSLFGAWVDASPPTTTSSTSWRIQLYPLRAPRRFHARTQRPFGRPSSSRRVAQSPTPTKNTASPRSPQTSPTPPLNAPLARVPAKAPPTSRPSTGSPAVPPVPPEPAGAPMVSVIRLVGLKHVKASWLRRWIFLQEGEAFSKKTLLGDLRRLRNTGYFSDVSAKLKNAYGVVEVTFVLKERGGRIQAVYFYNNKIYTQEQLLSQIQLQPSTLFNRALLEQDAARIIHVYHSAGHFQARVTVQGRWSKDELVLWFRIDEGEPANIRRVSFRGNRNIPSSALRGLLYSQPPSASSWFAGRGFYHPSFVSYDLHLMGNYYFDRGYIQNRITGPKLEVSRDRKWVTLIYEIHEGPMFRYGTVEFLGDLIQPAKKLMKLLTFKKGDVFNRTDLYKNNVLRLLKLYQDAGYYYARIQTVPNIAPDNNIHLQFYIVKGSLIRIERIEITGNTFTHEHAVRRYILLKKGDLFHAGKLLQSRIQLLSTGFFERNDPQLGIKVDIRQGTKPDHIILRFLVKEEGFRTWIYQFGFNYLPIEGAIFAGHFGKRNFDGHGRTLYGGGVISTTLRLWRVFANFFDPRLFDTELFLFATGYLSHHDNSSSANAGFIRDSQGGNLSLSHPLVLPQLRLGLNYRIERVSLSPSGNQAFQVPIANYYSTRLSSGLKLELRWDTRDRAVGPTKGFTLYGTYEHIAPYFGANYTMHKFEAGGRLFVPLPWQMTLKFAATAGWVLSPDANGVLPFERFPLDGSFFLVRGYFPYSIGPRRTVPARGGAAFQRSTLNWGGNKKFIFNAEFEVPLLRIPTLPISAVIFFDAGNAFDEHEWMFQDTQSPHLPLGLYMNLGFGFRMTVPALGVMRFEFGIPLNPRVGDPSVQINILVGEAF